MEQRPSAAGVIGVPKACFRSCAASPRVHQGFLQSTAHDDAWAKGVAVRFDFGIISLGNLIEADLHTRRRWISHRGARGLRSAGMLAVTAIAAAR